MDTGQDNSNEDDLEIYFVAREDDYSDEDSE